MDSKRRSTLHAEGTKHLEHDDQKPPKKEFLDAVINGLGKKQKELPCKFLYDEQGSGLFDTICELDEYYPTRTELHIMEMYIEEMVEHIGENVLLIEYGSGSSLKTRILLDHLKKPAGYIPIDISGEHLLQASSEITQTYPHLHVQPVCADYTKQYNLPTEIDPLARRAVYFPGSTIGNFHPGEAVEFLRSISKVLHKDGSLLLGVDLKKDPAMLHRAYNDRSGITAAFNKNILVRANRELGTNFRTDLFKHYAFFNPLHGRVEMHLVSLDDQTIRVNGSTFSIAHGESIHTENSYKYTRNEFESLASKADYTVDRVWTDENELFSVQLLRTGV